MKNLLKHISLLVLVFVTSFSAKLYSEEILDRATVEIASTNLFIPISLKGARLFHNEDGFTVVKSKKAFPIKIECLDKELRGLSNENLAFLLGLKAKINLNGRELLFTKISPKQATTLMANIDNDQESIQLSDEDVEEIISQLPPSSYIQVFQYSDGEYGLHLKTRLPGGGLWGATIGCWVGKFVASAICHGAILAVSAAVSVVGTPAAGYVVGAALETTLGSAIETFTTAGAIAGGVALAVATGPV